MLSKESKKKLDEMKRQLIVEDKLNKRLLNTNLDYAYLELLLKKIDADPNLQIDIKLANGDRMTISTKSKANQGAFDYNGIPMPNEL